MKIDGTDPLVLNKIKDQATRPEVQKLEEIEANIKILGERGSAGKGIGEDGGRFFREDLEVALKQANETADALNLAIRFKLHEESERFMVQIVNRLDDEVVKEIPAERILNLVGKIQEMIGLMLDEKR